MATDFSYNDKQILSSGQFKPYKDRHYNSLLRLKITIS